jgi:uncharacterized protein YbjT (DUF2867 family)
MIVITTPTGHIGSRLLETLLPYGEKLRVIARDPSRLPEPVKNNVDIIQGSLDDASVLSKAYQGADDLFFIVPPSMQYTDVNDYYTQFARPTCEAIDRFKVARVVFVSGTGLGYDKNAGPVSASFHVEQALAATNAALRVLHCGTFMENLLHSAQPIKYTGTYGTPVPADTKLPWVATRDIADTAARLLLDKTWTTKGSVGVLGPEDLSYGEVTRIMSSVLGKEIQYQEIPGETLKATVMQYGATDAAAQGLVDIYASAKRGTFNRVERSSQSSSPTTFREWFQDRKDLF